MSGKPKIIHYQRKPHLGNFSLEFIFQDVRNRLKDRFDIKKLEAKYVSKGLFKRLFIVLNANYYQGDVNHVTGDINFLTLGLKKEKTILTILDCGFVANHTGLKFHILKYFWLKLPLLKTALITTISEASKQEILKYVDYPKENIRVIPVAISPGFKFLESIPFNKSKPSFLHIGMAPNKNLIRVTEALKDLSAHYIIIGKLKPEYIEALKKNNISYENHFNLTEEELVKVYQKSDALIFASTYEGFGMPILEAQAMGKPVITSNISSMPEVAGDAACFVDPLDVNSIRAGIIKLIDDDDFRNEIIQKGFENIKRFDADRIANLYADVYEEIIISQRSEHKISDLINKTSFQKPQFSTYPALTEKPIILQIGTGKNSNLQRLIQATEGLSVQLEIIGDLNQEELEILNKSSPSFKHSNKLNPQEKIKAFEEAHIIFDANLNGNSSNNILEAQAIGRPIILSNTDSVKKIAGESACYVNPYIASEIRHAILNLLNAPEYRNEVIRKGLENVNQVRSEN